jgi:ornithine carbamoyltransferase
MSLKGRSLCSVRDLSAAEICEVLRLAASLKQQRRRGEAHALLAGKTLAMIFQKPSLRTRVSFEIGMAQLGGHAVYLAPEDIKLGRRETTEDVALVLGRMADMIVARTFGHDIVTDLARHAGVPVINGLSDREHPCQILADLMTIQEARGGLEGVRAAYIGDGNNMAHSLMYGAALTGLHMNIATPAGFEPLADITADAVELAAATASRIRVLNDPAQAVRDADVVYTDVWASMGQEAEAAARRREFAGFQVNAELLAGARPDCTILHCLPAHYGEEIDYETTRRPGSAIFDQAENRLHTQKALMSLLCG